MVPKPQLLTEQPLADAPSMRDLIGIAAAVEDESVRCYTLLSQEMERRGEMETAATFREMREMELGHQQEVERWAAAHRETVPPAQEFAWRLPPEIAASWDEIRNSSLLTSYRALAVAVTNEERAFALYAYLAAHATDPQVAREAEMLAREELVHAAELRVRRRQAYRREHGSGTRIPAAPIEDVVAFRRLEQRQEASAAVLHQDLADELAAIGDHASAALVASLVRDESRSSDPIPLKPSTLPAGSSMHPGSIALLRAALRPLEQASESYEELIASATDEALLRAEQAALASVVARIALLGRRIGEIDRAP